MGRTLTHLGNLPEKHLSNQEEVKLAKEGNPEAISEIIEANIGMVMDIAQKYCEPTFDLEDLFQQGIIGFHKAIKKFDPEQSVKVTTYAYFWIRQFIQSYIYRNRRTVSTTEHFEQAVDRYEEEKTDDASINPSKNLNLSKSLTELIRGCKKSNLSIEEENDKWGFLKSESNRPHTKVEKEDLNKSLVECISELSERKQTIILHRYGLRGHKVKTIYDLEYIVDLSYERIRQLEHQALDELEEHLKDYGYESVKDIV